MDYINLGRAGLRFFLARDAGTLPRANLIHNNAKPRLPG
jgi:hypothetical protein